jgi:pyridoxamine 5'-phosphate oxidase family protein
MTVNIGREAAMTVFTDAEVEYLRSQRLARLATSSASATPDVSAVVFSVDGDTITSGGYDITKTIRYRNLLANPQAVIVIDDLPTVKPWSPRGIKIRGTAAIEEGPNGLFIRITPRTIWTWGLVHAGDSEQKFGGVARRNV